MRVRRRRCGARGRARRARRRSAPDPLAAADDAEADPLVHPQARGRSRGTRRSGSSRCPPPRSRRRAPRAARGRRPGRAPRRRRRRCSRRRRVDAAARHRRDRDPAQDAAVLDRDEAVRGQMAASQRLPRRHLRLEGRVAGGDSLRVDPCDAVPVPGAERDDLHPGQANQPSESAVRPERTCPERTWLLRPLGLPTSRPYAIEPNGEIVNVSVTEVRQRLHRFVHSCGRDARALPSGAAGG